MSARPGAPARGLRRAVYSAVLAAGLASVTGALAAQEPAAPHVSRALEAESAGKHREAIAAWRAGVAKWWAPIQAV